MARRRAVAGTALVLIAYAALGVALTSRAWLADPARVVQGGGFGDVSLDCWFLTWMPYALGHGHNPFLSTWMDYPAGINLMSNASSPLLGLLSAPVTLLWGPIASFNLLETAGFVTSATAAYGLCRRWTSWRPAAFAGGLLYGFGPYMLGQGYSHLHLLVVPVPPLAALAVDHLYRDHPSRVIRWGAVLGALAGAQLLISTEVLASAAIMALVATVAAVVLCRRQAVARVRSAAVGLITATLVGGGSSAYPLWMAVAGPQHVNGLGPLSAVTFSADLLGPVVPDGDQLAPHAVSLLGDRLGGGLVENGSYLGILLLVLLAVVVVRHRHSGVVRVLAATAGVAFVISLGPYLVVDGHHTQIPLPAWIFGHLPFGSSLIPVRFSLYVALAAAGLLAIGIDRMARPPIRRQLGSWEGAKLWRRAVAGAVATVVLLPLVPPGRYHLARARLPAYFLTSAAGPARAPVAVTYPFPFPGYTYPLLWQSFAGLTWRTPGGYGLRPLPSGAATFFPPLSALGRVLIRLETGSAPTIGPRVARAALADLRAWSASTVVVVGDSPRAADAEGFFGALLGYPAQIGNGVWVWDLTPPPPPPSSRVVPGSIGHKALAVP